jgi:hypothetical protein
VLSVRMQSCSKIFMKNNGHLFKMTVAVIFKRSVTISLLLQYRVLSKFQTIITLNLRMKCKKENVFTHMGVTTEAMSIKRR